jgi:hypothetical protein
MFSGKLTIAPHNAELIEKMCHYHRDENFRIVKQRDDLIGALRTRSWCGATARRYAITTAYASGTPTMRTSSLGAAADRPIVRCRGARA